MFRPILRTVIAAAILRGGSHYAQAQAPAQPAAISALAVDQARYEITAGQAVPIAAPQETLNFLKTAKARSVQSVPRSSDAQVAGSASAASAGGESPLSTLIRAGADARIDIASAGSGSDVGAPGTTTSGTNASSILSRDDVRSRATASNAIAAAAGFPLSPSNAGGLRTDVSGLAASSANVPTISSGSGGIVAAPNKDGTKIMLGASLRTAPGEYTVTLTATAANGRQQAMTLDVVVTPRVSVPTNATRPPVVLLNGWETGFTGQCPVATSSSETFGNLASYLVSDGVPVIYLFDNCLEDPNQSIEQLGNDLGTFLSTIIYTNGQQVPQIDLVAFSLGGLIARSYLAGLQPTETLLPPANTLVRDLVLIATPNFGAFVVGNYAVEEGFASQTAELDPGSSFLYNLGSWNMRGDDLHGVNAIAIVGNAGLYQSNLEATTELNNASDGFVSLTSASLGFVAANPAVTRIVPYCHIDPTDYTSALFGTFLCNAPGIANVTDTLHPTGQIVRSFLGGTTSWETVGNAPTADPYLSVDGAFYFALANGVGAFVSNLTSVSFGTSPLVAGGDTGTVFYTDFAAGTGALEATSSSLGTINCETLAESPGYTQVLRCKLGLVIVSVSPLASGAGRTVNAGTALTLSGVNFGSQCSNCKVVATQAGSSTTQTLTVSSWTSTSIVVNLSATLSGLVTIQVVGASGSDALTVLVNGQSSLSASPTTLEFSMTAGGSAPASQTVQITNNGSGTVNWTATASASWITISPASGTAPSTLTVGISPAGLAAGTYTGNVSIAVTGASPLSVGVTLTIAAQSPTLSVSPQSLTFNFANGGAAPASQTVAIATGGGALAWTAASSAYWLVVSPASGSGSGNVTVSINPVNLNAGSYTGTVTVSSAGASGSPAAVSVTLTVTGSLPAPTISGVINAASGQQSFASATWVSIFGTNLSQSTYTWQASDFVNGALPTSLQGVSVFINGLPAYVEYISPTQINALAPDDQSLGTIVVNVTISGQGVNNLTARTLLSPAFFTFGDGYAAAEHLDYSLLGKPGLISGATTTPAQPGETIILYGTGFGATNPATPTGQLVATPEPLANAVQITIGGMTAQVTFAGIISPGLYQFNVVVPLGLSAGDANVVATLSGATSQSGVAITVQ